VAGLLVGAPSPAGAGIFGSDTRYRVTPTANRDPQWAIGRLEVLNANGTLNKTCTAWAYGSRTIGPPPSATKYLYFVTAAHCMYDVGGIWALQRRINVRFNDVLNSSMTCGVRWFAWGANYNVNNYNVSTNQVTDAGHDHAVLNTACTAPATTFPIIKLPNPTGSSSFVTGYPNDLPGMWEDHAGQLAVPTLAAEWASLGLDTTPGISGGPAFRALSASPGPGYSIWSAYASYSNATGTANNFDLFTDSEVANLAYWRDTYTP
jgi:V8-like Glu-specific endopeptidase